MQVYEIIEGLECKKRNVDEYICSLKKERSGILKTSAFVAVQRSAKLRLFDQWRRLREIDIRFFEMAQIKTRLENMLNAWIQE